MIDDWYEALNENEIIAACFLYISKCFETSDHDFLIQTFKYYGVNGNELKWFMNYMTNRSHVVNCYGHIKEIVYKNWSTTGVSTLSINVLIIHQ